MNYMWEEYELTYSHALEMRKEELLDPVLLKKEIQRLKTEIKALGTVNVNAIEDYKNVLERYEFLKGQHDDLVEAEKTWFRLLKNWILRCGNNLKNSLQRSQRSSTVYSNSFWRRKGNARIVRRRRHSRSGYSHYCTAAREKLQNMNAAFWWRKGADGHCTFVCYPKLKPSHFVFLMRLRLRLTIRM